jgi:hypothetical protein
MPKLPVEAALGGLAGETWLAPTPVPGVDAVEVACLPSK